MKIKLFFSTIIDGIIAIYQLIYGAIVIARMPENKVVIFGSSITKEQEPHFQEAYALAKELAKEGYGIITGGGPGIMVAANWGAHDGAPRKKNVSLGIGVTGIDVAFKNKYAQVINTRFFWIRKHLLLFYAQGYVFFPGGVGTADELFEVLNSYKHKLLPFAPIVLFGSHHWKHLNIWYKESVKENYIGQTCAELFVIVDTVEDALAALKRRL